MTARERRTSSIAASCSTRRRSSTSRARRRDLDAVRAQVVLERLEQVGVDRQRRPVALGRRQRAERRDGLRVPVDVELKRGLAGAVDQRQRRRRGLEPDLQPLRAAMRARVHPRAASAPAAPSATARENGSHSRPPALDGHRRRAPSGSSPAIGVEHEPARAARAARPSRARTSPTAARDSHSSHLGRGAQRRMALEDARARTARWRRSAAPTTPSCPSRSAGRGSPARRRRCPRGRGTRAPRTRGRDGHAAARRGGRDPRRAPPPR